MKKKILIIIISLFGIFIIVAIILYKKEGMEREKKAQDALSTAVNGIVYDNVALKDAHDEAILSDVKTTCSWKVFNGQMTKLDAELKVLEWETKIKNSNIKNEALAKSWRLH